MSKKRVMKLASRGKRLGAYCIDAVIPFATLIILMAATGSTKTRSRQYLYDPFGGYGYGYGNGNSNGFGYDYGYGTPQISGAMAALVTFTMLVFLIYLIVQLIFFRKSKTMGKAALGLQVISSNNGRPIGFWMMLLREWIVKSASSRVFFLGYIWVMIDEKNRGWHDKILDTYVIDEKESAQLNRPEQPAEIIHEPVRDDITSIISKEPELPVVKDNELPVIVESSRTEEYVEVSEEEMEAPREEAEIPKEEVEISKGQKEVSEEETEAPEKRPESDPKEDNEEKIEKITGEIIVERAEGTAEKSDEKDL